MEEFFYDDCIMIMHNFNESCDRFFSLIKSKREASKLSWFNESKYNDSIFLESKNVSDSVKEVSKKSDNLVKQIEDHAKNNEKVCVNQQELNKVVNDLQNEHNEVVNNTDEKEDKNSKIKKVAINGLKGGIIATGVIFPAPGTEPVAVAAASLVDTARTLRHIIKDEEVLVLKEVKSSIDKMNKQLDADEKGNGKDIGKIKRIMNKCMFLLSRINNAMHKPVLKVAKNKTDKNGNISKAVKQREINKQEIEKIKNRKKDIKENKKNIIKESYQDAILDIQEFNIGYL